MTSSPKSESSNPSYAAASTLAALKSEVVAVQKEADLLRRRSNTLTTLLVMAFLLIFGSLGLVAYQLQRQTQAALQIEQAAELTSVESAAQLQERLQTLERQLQALETESPENFDDAIAPLNEAITQIAQQLGVQKQDIQTIQQQLQQAPQSDTAPSPAE